MDVAAKHLAIDPADIRRRNMIPASAMPYTTPTGAVYDSGDYAAALQLLLDTSDYAGLREEQSRRHAAGGTGRARPGAEHVRRGHRRQGRRRVRPSRTHRGRLRRGAGRHDVARPGSCHHVHTARVRAARDPRSDGAHRAGRHRPRAGRWGHTSLALDPARRQRVADASGRLRARLVDLVADQLEVAADDVVSYGAAGMGVSGVPASAVDWVDVARPVARRA